MLDACRGYQAVHYRFTHVQAREIDRLILRIRSRGLSLRRPFYSFRLRTSVSAWARPMDNRYLAREYLPTYFLG